MRAAEVYEVLLKFLSIGLLGIASLKKLGGYFFGNPSFFK
jgi:hypothetical protein